MDRDANGNRITGRVIVQFILGVVAFGLLMGARSEFHSIWVRAMIAGCGFVVLGFFALPLRKQ